MFVAAAQEYVDSCTDILERSPGDLQLKAWLCCADTDVPE